MGNNSQSWGAGGLTADPEPPPHSQTSLAEALEESARELDGLLGASRSDVEALGRDFEALAARTDGVLELAARMVGSEGCGQAMEALPRVQRMGAAAGEFVHRQLTGSSRILETVTAQGAVLARLAQRMREQKAIVREMEMLRVLTNIEVARLGDVGAGFLYLAHELDEFSQAVATSTSELTVHTQQRRIAWEEMRRGLARALPEMRAGLAAEETSLERALAATDAMGHDLCEAPQRFRACVDAIAGQIAGVVAAIQAHDITRQQMEHVREALKTMAAELRGPETAVPRTVDAPMRIRTGLTIQRAQLRHIRETAASWTAQIRDCLEAMERVAAQDLTKLGSMVMAQEQTLAAQLARIEELEQKSMRGNEKLQASLGGLAALMQLVGEHLERSKAVRDRLQLLMFNSIIEARHLGAQADGILEISTSIQRISAAWRELTAESEAAMQEILALAEENRATVETLAAGTAALCEAQAETRRGLEQLCAAAASADAQGTAIAEAVDTLQEGLGDAASARDQLVASFAGLESIVDRLEEVEQQMGAAGRAGDIGKCDVAEMERVYGASYTTEAERAVLRAALGLGGMPVAEPAFAGNGVELF
jgi:hypothetical protein